MSETPQTDFAVSQSLNDCDGIGSLAELSSRLIRELAEASTTIARQQMQIDSMCDAEQLRQLRAEIAALREELAAVRSGSAKVIRNFREDIAALREDKARLDWLNEHGEPETFEDAPHEMVWSVIGKPDLRAAIDAARKQP